MGAGTGLNKLVLVAVSYTHLDVYKRQSVLFVVSYAILYPAFLNLLAIFFSVVIGIC